MRSLTSWRLVQGFYWLAAGTWFGALVMLCIVAPTTFRTIYEQKPVMPAFSKLDPAAIAAGGAGEGFQSMMQTTSVESMNRLAGSIVGRSIDGLRRLQWICAVVIVLAVLLHHTVFARRMPSRGLVQWLNNLRVTLILVPVLVLAADSFWISPQMKAARAVKNDPAQAEEAVARAERSFDRYHGLSERLISVQIAMLGAAILASGFALHGTAGDPAEQGMEHAGTAEHRA
ncbi:MAG: hypothetical protein CMJ18_25695 [Phycisphaeraceae bacterium]|nr:hypothetical protein [Phycisphaeraceae bacterium]